MNDPAKTQIHRLATIRLRTAFIEYLLWNHYSWQENPERLHSPRVLTPPCPAI